MPTSPPTFEQPFEPQLPSLPTSLPSNCQSLSPGSCTLILVHRCPACFAGCMFGQPLDKGGDIHVTTDGSCPQFYEPTYFIPKAKASYEAADGNKKKAAMDCFDDTGIMALICHHNIPLFFANIDMPGEQQKYSVVLLECFFSHLPSTAMVVVLYDIGGVLARSLAKYDILNNDVISCLCFATTAMHAYGHEWACQLVFNPCLISGLGHSDGEGMEHLWSHFIKCIGIEQALLVS
ncbi:hypothetical protein BKA82DRAFT_4328417 [Pisolithus tinctorius]|nr:hypothetical protein BKA82DRAFT_4328417 [Pisolithus tinctorius]